MSVWDCTSVSADPAGSCSNCHLRTYTEPVITNTRHDIYSESIYHSSTWSLGQRRSQGIFMTIDIISVWNLLSNIITCDDRTGHSLAPSQIIQQIE